MKTAFVSAALFALLLPSTQRAVGDFALTTAPTCENILVHEPIVMFELSGSSFAGPVERLLTIYGDGSMKLAAADAAGPGKCSVGQLTPENALAFQQALAQAGAGSLCDDGLFVTDVPLRTLTFLRGGQDTRAHTFSYWLGDGDYAAVDALLEDFIAEQFPGF